jgi:hypothetical protein
MFLFVVILFSCFFTSVLSYLFSSSSAFVSFRSHSPRSSHVESRDMTQNIALRHFGRSMCKLVNNSLQ